MIALVAWSVVNLPAAAVVLPIDGGDARYVEKPAPLTVLLAESVVNVPVDAVVEPTGPGAANVAPPSVAALIDPLQIMPAPFVYPRAFAAPVQPGIEYAATFAVEPVAFARIVFAGCCAI